MDPIRKNELALHRRSLRVRRFRTQLEHAEAAGLSRQTVVAAENGDPSVTLESLSKLGSALGLDDWREYEQLPEQVAAPVEATP